jgi:DNA-binding GntR family transcriptional regulator
MTRQMYRRIADDLRERIGSGDLRPGYKLPTHEELMKDYATTRITVRRALEELTRERLIVGRPPIGMFVRDQQRHRLQAGPGTAGFTPSFPSFGDQLLAALDGPFSQNVDVQVVAPLTGVAVRLRSEEPAVLRHRLMYSGQDPVMVCNAYFPTKIAVGTEIDQAAPLSRSTFAVLDDLGYRIVRLVDEVFVRTTDPYETHELGWMTGTPVFAQMHTGYTSADVPVMCEVTLMPGDTWILATERTRDDPPAMRAVG